MVVGALRLRGRRAGRGGRGRVLEQAVSGYPDLWLGYDSLGVALHKLKQERRARELWRQGLAREKTCQLHAHLGAALSAEGGGALPEGLAQLQAAAALCPRVPL